MMLFEQQNANPRDCVDVVFVRAAIYMYIYIYFACYYIGSRYVLLI